ncbi:MAG: MFS transporter [Candidatus Brocadiia bacterium]|jgi:MFS family permease
MEALQTPLRRIRTPLTEAEIFLRRYFARRIVQPWQLPSIMRKHIYTGALGSIWGSVITGMFFTYYGMRIGLKPFHWGIMGAIVSWGLSAEILSARATHRFMCRKLIWFICAFSDRTLRFLGIVLSLWLWHAHYSSAATVLIAAICVANCFGAMSTTPWLSWVADYIPEEVHGRFWGKRTAWIAIIMIIALMSAAVLMDRTQERWKLELTVIIFIAATIFGLLDLIIHGTIPEPPMAKPPENSFLEEILLPIRDINFRPWLKCNLIWYFIISLGGTLALLFCMDNLKLQRHFLVGMIVITVVPLLGSVLTATWSGGLIDRVGPKKVIYWAYLAWAPAPLFWIFATPQTAAFWVCGSSLVGGTAVTAAANAATKLVTRFPTPAQRAMYIAVSDTSAFIGNGLGALAAGLIARRFAGWHCVLGGRTFSIFHAIFVVSAVLGIIAVPILLKPVKDPASFRPQTAESLARNPAASTQPS